MKDIYGNNIGSNIRDYTSVLMNNNEPKLSWKTKIKWHIQDSSINKYSLSLVNADISSGDTSICQGAEITLQVSQLLSSSGSGIPFNLQNGLMAYYPFNGNANDESGNGNNGNVNGEIGRASCRERV